MPTLREYLILHRDEIKCTACGDCCPDSCALKTQQKTCAAHPTLVGEEQAQKERGMTCIADPVYLGVRGIACPPVLDIIEQITGITPETEILPNGQRIIKGYDACDKKNPFIQLLNQEIIPLSATIFDSSQSKE